MADAKDFQQQVQRIGERVQELETIADPAVRSSAKELVHLLMEMHGSALERMLEIIFQSSDGGTRVIDELGQDPLVSSLLVLYGLHPEELQTRVERKLAEVRSRLYKMGAEATLVAVNGSDIRVRVSIEGHVCGSTTQNVKAAVEEAIYEAAPDLTSLVVEGLEEPAPSGFVAMDALLGASSAASRPAATLGHDGMD
ncbi:MAG: hypothetical protein WBS19_00205 [Candidatus Korobacteraceae bacterium]